MLKIKFIKKAATVMRDAIEEARVGGEIVETQWRELNGDLYMQIPKEEVQPWIMLLEDLSDAYPDKSDMIDIVLEEINALADESKFKRIGGELKGERDGMGPEPGAAGVSP